MNTIQQCPKCGCWMTATTSGYTCMACGNREPLSYAHTTTSDLAKPYETKKETKYCMECGKLVNINAKFCENCGIRL